MGISTMNISEASLSDAVAICRLISQLGYVQNEEFMELKLEQIQRSDNEEVILYSEAGRVVALVAVVYVAQLAFEGDFCIINYLVVDQTCRGKGIGKKLEEYIAHRAKTRGCSHIEVFSLNKRSDAHRFYERQGYKVMEKYFGKEL